MANRMRSALLRALPLLAALLVASSNPAMAQQHEPTGLQRLFDFLGLIEIPDDPIDYRERAPLVVPPSPSLVPPRSPDDMRAVNPDWPVDHDNRRMSPAQAEAQKRHEDDFYSGKVLGPARLSEGTRRGSGRNNEYAGQSSDEQNRDMNALGPNRLGFKGWGKGQEAPVLFRGEPERRALTDPPVGLRTPSPDAPYGVVSTKTKAAKTVLDRSASPDDPALRK
jgi:hypothetical protein